MKDFYGGDLAYAHDAGFAEHVRGACAHIVRRLKRSVPRGGLVYDLGCGSGVSSRALKRAGFRARAAASYGAYCLAGGRYMVTAVKPEKGKGCRQLFCGGLGDADR